VSDFGLSNLLRPEGIKVISGTRSTFLMSVVPVTFGLIWPWFRTARNNFFTDRHRTAAGLTCLQQLIDIATQWVYGWSRLITGYKEAKVAEVKPSQNLPLRWQDCVKVIQNSTFREMNE